MNDEYQKDYTGQEIAVIGMAARFPGARNIDEFWDNLKNGVESIRFFSVEELVAAGVEQGLLENPAYVKCGGGILQGKEYFDAAFFGYSVIEAQLMDPQLRLFHECAWHALENAAYNPYAYEGLIGLYAGASFNFQWEALAWLSGKTRLLGNFAGLMVMDRDYLCTRVSYQLNLRGPSVIVKTACSTSLAAIHMACQGLLNGECDMALAGGAAIILLKESGYLYQEGIIFSPDGHCRAFDAQAKGTVMGDGVGIVVLKRLEEAERDRDHIHAVIKGTAINNDGLHKAGFTAPSVFGQAAVIKEALGTAEIDPETITYVETHGTGTTVGDPIEIEALKMAFATSKKQYCAIGSVKTNMGHLDCAAGVAGFIKTVLALENRQIPPSLHYEKANPRIDFANSPFYVNARLKAWKPQANGVPRAGVSSFGIGGTNVHVILEAVRGANTLSATTSQPTCLTNPTSLTRGALQKGDRQNNISSPPPSFSLNAFYLLLLSAKTPTALEKMISNLVEYLPAQPGIAVADAAYTLAIGRGVFPHRALAVYPIPPAHSPHPRQATAEDHPFAIQAHDFQTGQVEDENTRIVFMFPGQGSQYENMGRELYETQPIFREVMDRCFAILEKLCNFNIKDILYPPQHEKGDRQDFSAYPLTPAGACPLDQTAIAQPLLFIFEYSLAQLLLSWGIRPAAMIGHSIGEYTAACLSGVFSLEDALKLVVLRGKLMQSMPPGKMLSVPLPEKDIVPLLDAGISLAVVNSSTRSVVSGPAEDIARFEKKLQEKGIRSRYLHTSHAFHSAMMLPILKDFEQAVRAISLHSPQVPYISNVSGQPITAAEVTDPAYWARHIRSTVRFAEGIAGLLQKERTLFIEVGPGNTLRTLVRQHKNNRAAGGSIDLVPHPKDGKNPLYHFLNAVGQCWLHGVNIDWKAFYGSAPYYRIPLPLYPFESQRYWFDDSVFRLAQQINEMESNRDLFYQTEPPAGPLAAPSAAKTYMEQKGDRLNLADSDTDPVSVSSPEEKIQATLVHIWQEFFGHDRIPLTVDFADLGGDSLTAAAVIARIHKDTGVHIPLDEFFKAPTIPAVAQFIIHAKVRGTGSQERFAHIEAVEKKEYYPLTSAQRRFFVLKQLDAQGTAYNINAAGKLTGKIDKTRFEHAINKLVERHESLRTSFHMIGETPVQVIHLYQKRWSQKVLFSREAADRLQARACAASSTIQNFIAPFDLTQPPLFRIGLLEMAKDEYILIMDMHHIISDGTSIGLLAREFMSFYEGRELEPLRVQYKDYASWLASPATKEKIRRQEEYWLQEFSGELPVLDLPLDYTRPLSQDFSGSRETFEIDPQQTRRLKIFAVQHSVTLFALLLTAYNIFLSKICNQEDIVTGTPIAGRDHLDLEPIIGMFVNTLVLRNYPHGEKTFNEFLEEVKQRTFTAFANSLYPYENLVEKLPVNRDTGRNPLIDTLFVLQNYEFPVVEIEGLALQPVTFDQGTTILELTLTVFERDGKLLCIFNYCTRLFKQATIEKFIQYYRNALTLALQQPDARLADFDLIPPAEKEQMLYAFNDTAAPYPHDKTIHQLFEDQAAKTPGRIALIFEDERLTYQALHETTNHMSLQLQAHGLQPGDIAAVMVPRSLLMITGILAILKAGAAYLPIDPTYPQERIDYILKDSAATLLIMQESLKGDRRTWHVHPLSGFAAAHHISSLPVPSKVSAANLAYTIYTSGSTGRPKGVMIRHFSLVNRLLWMQSVYGLTAVDKILQKTPYTFDVSLWELFWWAISGAQLCLLVPGGEKDPQVMIDTIYKHGVTVMHFVPSMLDVFLEYVKATPGAIAQLSSLRQVIASGEALTPTMVTRFNETLYQAHGARLANLYGPTETTVDVTYFDCPPGLTLEKVPIGKPIHNTQLLILDKNYHLQPTGTTGELFITGDCLAAGYLNNPELTAEKFIIYNIPPGAKTLFEKRVLDSQKLLFSSLLARTAGSLDPSAPRTHGPFLYKTGDLVRWLPDGNIDFLGRFDHQVKIRGFRVETGEIETRLLQHPAIKEALVIAQNDPGTAGENYLAAYIVPKHIGERKEIPAGENQGDLLHQNLSGALREYLTGILPAYMIPSYFVILESFPLTASGKVDRKALPLATASIKAGENGESAHSAPENDTERALVRIWSTVLGIETQYISMTTHFFQAGGHSLRAAVMVSKIQQELHVTLPLAQVFRTPRIRDLARYIAGQRQEVFESIPPVEEREYYPLTPAQTRLYILQQMQPENTSYHMPTMLSIEGPIDLVKMQEVFQKLIARHETLRTSFHILPDHPQPVQIILPSASHLFEKRWGQKLLFKGVHAPHASHTLPNQERELKGDRPDIVSAFIQPFDLSQAPLFRVRLVEIEPAQYILMMDMHHIISDNTSHEILVREFVSLYAGDELPPLKLRYRDYAVWLNSHSQQQYLQQQETYWLETLAGELPMLRLPTDIPYPHGAAPAVNPETFNQGQRIDFEIDETVTQALKELSSARGVTLYMVFFAVFDILMAKLSSQEDIIAGTDIEGRRHADLENVFGMFVNTLVIRCFPRAGMVFEEFLEQVKERTLQAFENRDYPFDRLVEKLQVNREEGRNPLFDVMFAMQERNPVHQDSQAHEKLGFSIRPYLFRRGTAIFDLLLVGMDTGQRISFYIEYRTALFKEETITRFIGYFKEIAAIVVGNPGIVLKDIAISHDLLAAEAEVQPVEFNF